MVDFTGRTFGKYKVIARLAEGAMGEVYKGYHPTLDRYVAIKVLHRHLATTRDFIERFEREAAVVARLRHTNIMQVFDFDLIDGMPYMVMEFLDGPTLKAEMEERRESRHPLNFFEIAYIINALAASLDYAHVRGVIHRDLKPANVMFNVEGQIVLTDFGIVHIVGDAGQTAVGTVIGTPAYMPPEQGRGEEVGPASDIYALGVLLFQLLTGQLPYTADSAMGLVMKHVSDPIPRPKQFNRNIPDDLEQIVIRALQKQPAQRFQRAGHLARDMRQAIGMTAEQALATVSIASVPPPNTPVVALDPAHIEGDPDVTMIASTTGGSTVMVGGPGPYRGLFAFREIDARFFFGREEFTERLVELAHSQPMVAVVGPSGSGKSSVVFAGLVASIRQPGGWLIEDFRPSNDPFQSLAAALTPLLQPALADRDQPAASARLAGQLRRGEQRLHELIANLTAGADGPHRLLLVADQFEEVFTLCDDPALRQRFFEELLEAVDIQKFLPQQTFTLVLTLRADFLGQALTHGAFAQALQDADVKLGPMSRQDLGRAIVSPAKRLGVNFESGLALRIINDVGDEPGNLPLLEFALSALWEQRDSSLMTHKAYERIGGVAGALARHANDVYGRLSLAEQKLARRAFVQMVQPGEGTEDTRRVALRDELTDAEWKLAQKLATDRLVVTGVNASGNETVEVVHEALIRNWGLLREWMAADRSFRAWQERLRAAMNQWQTSGRDEGALLRGVLLQQALEWSQNDDVNLSTMEASYIGRSQDAAQRVEQEQEAQRQRELEQAQALSESRRRQIVVVRWASVGLGILVLLAICGATFAFVQRSAAQANAREAAIQATAAFAAQGTAVANEQVAATRAVEAENARSVAVGAQATAEAERAVAEEQRVRAEEARNEAETERAEAERQGRLALAQSLVSLSRATLEETNDDEVATLLALEAANLNRDARGQLAWFIDSALRPLISRPHFNITLEGHTGDIRAVAIAPDNAFMISGALDNTVRIWPLGQPGNEVQVLAGHEAPVLAVAVAPDSRLIASAGEDRSIRIWSVADLSQPPAVLTGHEDAVLALVFLPDGSLISASLDRTLRRWNPDNPGLAGEILLTTDRHILGLAANEAGSQLALAGDDRTVRLFDLASRALRIVGQHDSSVIAVSYAPDETRLASASVDSTVRVWDLAGGPPIILTGHESRVRGVVFLPDGQRVMSGSDDSTVRVWDLRRPNDPPLVLRGHELRVRSLAISPDSRFVASGSDDQTIRLWRTDPPAAANRILTGHNANVLAVIFTPDGQIMATSGADNNVRLWNTANFGQGDVLSGHTDRVRALAYAPGRRLLASGGDDSTFRLWRLDRLDEDPLVLTEHRGSVRALVFTADEQRLYSAGDDGVIRIWDLENLNAPPATFAELDEAIYVLGQNPDESQFVAAGEKAVVTVWDLTDPAAPPTVLEGHGPKIRALAYSPDGQTLATAAEDWTVRLWNMADLGAEPIVLTGHSSDVRGVAFTPDGQTLVTTSKDNTVRIWDLTDLAAPPTVLEGHTAAVIGVAVSPDQAFFATVSDDGTVRLWHFLDRLIEAGCDLVGRNLTPAEWELFVSGEPYRPTCPNRPRSE